MLDLLDLDLLDLPTCDWTGTFEIADEPTPSLDLVEVVGLADYDADRTTIDLD